MTQGVIPKAALVWLGIACLAIVNGVVRENILVPVLGMPVALPLSGVTLSLLVFLMSWFTFDFFGKQTRAVYFLIGIQWVLMTLVFEFVFGHYVAGKPWPVILEIFDIAGGNLMPLVLLVSLLAPYWVARLKHTI